MKYEQLTNLHEKAILPLEQEIINILDNDIENGWDNSRVLREDLEEFLTDYINKNKKKIAEAFYKNLIKK